MFISKDLIFLELQKTGGSHILRLLSQCVDGEVSGKHNRLKTDYANKFVIGSIRNPWDWYVSLWAYGVAGKGAIRARIQKGLDPNYYWRELPKYMGKNWLAPNEILLAIFHDYLKPTSTWEAVYQDANDPQQFREWLKLLLNKDRSYDFGEGFAFSPVSYHAGLMTYRYLRLFTLGGQIYRNTKLATPEGIKDFDKEHNVAKAMIRTEFLEDDFILALGNAGYPLTEEKTNAIRSSEKTNRSEHNKAAFYYDQETLDIVAAREYFLIEKYSYGPPVLDINT